jgi:hypothetical protein
MAIAAAIISGVLGTASLVAGVAGSKAQAEEQKEALEGQREFESGEAEKERRLKERQLKLEGLDTLAGERIQAEERTAKRSFNRDALAGMRMAMQRRGQRATTPQPQQVGLPTTTFGRAA